MLVTIIFTLVTKQMSFLPIYLNIIIDNILHFSKLVVS